MRFGCVGKDYEVGRLLFLRIHIHSLSYFVGCSGWKGMNDGKDKLNFFPWLTTISWRGDVFYWTSKNSCPPCWGVYRNQRRRFFFAPGSPYFQAYVDCPSSHRSPWPSHQRLQNTPTVSLQSDKPSPYSCPGYDIKQSNVVVPVILEVWGMRRTPLLPSQRDPLWPGAVASDRVLFMGQIELNCVLMLNWTVWNRTVSTFKLHTYGPEW